MDKALMNEILEVLTKDARVTPATIAAMLRKPESEIAAAIAWLEEQRIIVKYATMVNPDTITDEKVSAMIEVRVSPQREQGFDAIAERIYRFDEVDTVLLMSGGFDLMVMVEGKTMREVAMFVAQRLSTLENVLSTATHFVLKHYKLDGVIMEESERDERLAVHA